MKGKHFFRGEDPEASTHLLKVFFIIFFKARVSFFLTGQAPEFRKEGGVRLPQALIDPHHLGNSDHSLALHFPFAEPANIIG